MTTIVTKQDIKEFKEKLQNIVSVRGLVQHIIEKEIPVGQQRKAYNNLMSFVYRVKNKNIRSINSIESYNLINKYLSNDGNS